MREKRLLAYPMKLTVAYLLVTLGLFLFGPIRWRIPSYPKVTIVLLVYIFAFALGYHVQMKQRLLRISSERLALLSDPDQPTFGFLKELPVRHMTLAFTVSCAYSILRCVILLYTYYGGVDFSKLLSLSLSTAYFDRLSSAMTGTWYVLFLNLINVLDTFWYILGILYFKRFSKMYKCLFFATLMFNVLYTASGGTMIGWAVFIFKLVPFLLLAWYRSRYSKDSKKRRKNRYLLLVIVVMAVLFVLLFSMVQEARYIEMGYEELTFETEDLQPFIEKVDRWPVIHSIIYPIDFYVTHGYCGFAYALELPAEFTYGLGFSRDTAMLIKDFFGIDLSDRTYPQRIEDSFGWINGQFWPSAYTWFASDITFWGIPILMFAFGWFLCRVWYSALYENSMIAVTLFSWLWIGIIFIPANNQLFQSFGVFMATVSLIVMFGIRKHLPLFVFRRDDSWRRGRVRGRSFKRR